MREKQRQRAAERTSNSGSAFVLREDNALCDVHAPNPALLSHARRSEIFHVVNNLKTRSLN